MSLTCCVIMSDFVLWTPSMWIRCTRTWPLNHRHHSTIIIVIIISFTITITSEEHCIWCTGVIQITLCSSYLVVDLSVELKGQVNSFLKCAFKCGFCSKLYTKEATADDTDMDLFQRLIPVIVFTLSFLLLNLVTTTSDPKNICMNCPDVTLRCTKSHLCHVVSLSTFFACVLSLYCTYCLSLLCVHVRLLRVTLNINQSIKSIILLSHILQNQHQRQRIGQHESIKERQQIFVIYYKITFDKAPVSKPVKIIIASKTISKSPSNALQPQSNKHAFKRCIYKASKLK